jgi:ribonuclease HII
VQNRLKIFNDFGKIKMQEQKTTIDEKSNPKNHKVSAGSTFLLEKKLIENGYDFVIGVDEAGRGPLCGPVVACAVALRNNQSVSTRIQTTTNNQSQNNQTEAKIQNTEMWELVRDSKKLSEKQRENIFDFIYENFYVGIGLCSHETIDRINILEASFLAMKKAIASLKRAISNDQSPMTKPRTTNYELRTMVLVDGNKGIPNFSLEQRMVIGGDKIVKSISAASIVAKVTRDRLMKKLHQDYPQYGFDKHKGYGTKLHMAMLLKFGPCEIHRKSFAPVKKSLTKLK